MLAETGKQTFRTRFVLKKKKHFGQENFGQENFRQENFGQENFGQEKFWISVIRTTIPDSYITIYI